MTIRTPIADRIWDRIEEYKRSVANQESEPSERLAFGNSCVRQFIEDDELPYLTNEVAAKFEEVLRTLIIDTSVDHNSKETAKRWAKMYINELYQGRYAPPPKVTVFPNVTQCDELYVVGPIMLRSACAHHMAPIMGEVWVGVLPKDKLIGLSKFHRTIEHIGSRAQIQEELTMMIADALEELTEPNGLAVLVKASHQCCSHRGVKDANSRMVTSVLRGAFRDNASTRAEFYRMVELSK